MNRVNCDKMVQMILEVEGTFWNNGIVIGPIILVYIICL
jgi:hypothetical protein